MCTPHLATIPVAVATTRCQYWKGLGIPGPMSRGEGMGIPGSMSGRVSPLVLTSGRGGGYTVDIQPPVKTLRSSNYGQV